MKNGVLVCGASFAGLATAYWMRKLGYGVTVVEIAPSLKRGGTPVNIQGATIDIVKRMGLFDRIHSRKLAMEVLEFKNSADVTVKSHLHQRDSGQEGEPEYEIERDVLLDMLFDLVKEDVEFVFGDSVATLKEQATDVDVTFQGGRRRSFGLVFGCDGIHSSVRKFCFGDEAEFSHFLEAYFSISIVDKLLIRENTTQMYNEPGKAVMLNAYNNKTDIVLCYFSQNEVAYDYRDQEQQRTMIGEQFSAVGWRTSDLLVEVKNSKTFYFDKLCQMKMPSWTTGRVALVGDAAYCASAAAGKGGSLAIDGAAALAEAFEKCDGDFGRAFQEYDRSFRPFIEQVQADALKFGLDMLLPRTEAAIRRRNTQATSRELFGDAR